MRRVAKQIHLSRAHNQGIYGRGIGVAILDTGINPHPDLVYPENRIVGFFDTINNRKNAYDDNFHGTHVAGILAGSGRLSHGKYIGVAPACQLVGVKVLNQKGEGYIRDFMRGIDLVLQNQQKYNLRIVNISIASVKEQNYNEQSEFVKKVDAMWDAGLVVVASAGNLGPGDKTIGAPGNSRKIITVGSSDEDSHYAGRGPTSACVKKPDIVAPGHRIVSCGRSGYTVKSGTSMSCPIISGAVALLLSKYPHMTNLEVKIRLKNSAIDLGRTHAVQGWGMLDISRLF